MEKITAKVFRAGNSKALRLPRALNVKAKAFHVSPTATGFVATDPVVEARRQRALQELWGSCPDFPDVRK